MRSRFILGIFAGLTALSMTACGGGSGTAPPVGAATAQPTVLNLYPNQSSNRSPLLTVMVTSVGSAAVNMPLAFDTGSAGVTLYAESIFPASMVTSSGFIFPAGQTSITYNGITVTNLQSTRSYGTLNKTVEHGNLGFAPLTFGDTHGTLTTQLMPVLLFYSIDYVTGHGFAPPSWQGWFGVASTDGTMDVAGAMEPAGGFDACTQQSVTSCYVVSAMKYLQYGAPLNAGFMLSPAPIQTCDITTPGSCSPVPMLTVGLTPALESGFSTSTLTCPPTGYIGPQAIAGYPVCQKNIPGITIAASGASAGTFTGDVTFDTGTDYQDFSTPAGSSFPATIQTGSTVNVTMPSGFEYTYTTAATGLRRRLSMSAQMATRLLGSSISRLICS
jgi:hypothetical protein